MTGVFKPRMGILPPAQQRLWPELRPAAELGFALYGGTAIALRLGHRNSVDFDFFSEKPLDRDAIHAAFPFVAISPVLQDQQNTFTVNVPCGSSEREHVKVSFFGTIGFGRVGEPEVTEDGVLHVASLDDLMATKVKVILQRAEAKDYRDIAAMVSAGVSLAKGLSAARALYGINFQPSESLKAMVYFDDGDLRTLTKGERTCLVKAVSEVRDLPNVEVLARRLIASNLSLLPATDAVEASRRMAVFPELEATGGATYNFWQVAKAAIEEYGGDVLAVDWQRVELVTIKQSIGEHGQSPASVHDALCKHSPGAVTASRQEAIRVDIERLAPQLQSQFEYERAKDRGLSPGN